MARNENLGESLDILRVTPEEIHELALYALQARDYADYSVGQDMAENRPRDRWMFPTGEDNVMCIIPDAHKKYPDVRIVASYCIGHSFSGGNQLFRVEDCNLSNHGYFTRKPKYRAAISPTAFSLNDMPLSPDTTKLILPPREIMKAQGKEEERAQASERKVFTDMANEIVATDFTRVHLVRFRDALEIGFEHARLNPAQAIPKAEQVG